MFDVRRKMARSVRRSGFLLSLLILFAATSHAFAAAPSVTAVLTNSQPAVGEAVELQIKVSGARKATVPEAISVDGLQIQKTDQEAWESHFSFGLGNNGASSSVNYLYTVVPLRPGEFKIPSQTIRVGDESLKTPELTLHVADGSGKNTRGATAGTNKATQPWAQLNLVNHDVYIGQPIQAQIEIGFDARIRIDPQSLQVGPELSIPGFVVRRAEQIQQVGRIIDGVRQRVFIYKVAITPAKTGHFDVPAKLAAQVQYPVLRQPRSLQLDPGIDHLQDLYEQMQEMMQDIDRYSPPTQLDIVSEPVSLNVKPLPPNAPPGFSGAIGNFTMAVDAKPKKLQVGDPITVTAAISGRGNFDRMTGPTLQDESGWHKYPPSSKFKQDDDVGISGEKTFETIIAPNEKKTELPPLTFAYFDPVKEDYVTLRSDPVPIQVEGGAAPAPTVAAASAGPTQSAPTVAATPAPVSKPEDILYQLNDLGQGRSFTPIYARPAFWIFQLAPLIALLAFAGWMIRANKVGNREALRVASLQHESAELLRNLRRGELSPQEYFSNASRVARVKTALVKNIDPNAVDAETIAKTFDLGENERARLQTLLARTDELRYSGAGNGDRNLGREDRDDVLELLESLHA